MIGMIPLRDVIPSRTTPWITLLLIAMNLLVFGYELALPPVQARDFVRAVGLVPAAFDWTAALTSIFVHAGWLHVGTNVLLLWLFGDSLESRMGHGRFLLFYLLAGLAGGLAETASTPGSAFPVVGSSGALAGVVGGYLTLFPDSRVLVLVPAALFVDVIEVPAVFFAALWLAMQAASGVGWLTDIPAESLGLRGLLGGCAAGVVGVWCLSRRMRWDRSMG